MRFNVVYIGLMVLGLTACSTYQQVTGLTTPTVFERTQAVCELDLDSDDWISAFLLSPEKRAEALNVVETPEDTQQVLLRAMLLTHSEASYRDLREAEDLIINQLPLNQEEVSGCETNELVDYILKLNQMLQKQKSEVVLLQRQINEQNKAIEAQKAENAELDKKIEALTNIEHRMKTRANNVEPEVLR
ncbi:hypothetical protein [Alkalimarinus alittae]|uniref:Lipoprotein n=1 Tax=Alkalimarinus alittae TaxID=2961619 RepID=A0ABY6N3V3_9ALTE|nr:hypothetical protein [Alkalimarinus alittae]UZE96801.1 hypothetical protein NKI27_03350 [Alkalimarinus alittae]